MDYAQVLAGRYATLVNQTYDRYDRILDEARARRYSADRLVSDTIASWADLVDAWCLPIKLIGGQQYVVRFDIKTNTLGAVEAIQIPNLGPRNVASTNLTHDNPTNPPILANKVDAKVTGGGGFLVVTLSNLTPPPLALGRYTGQVKDAAAQPVAFIEVNVT